MPDIIFCSKCGLPQEASKPICAHLTGSIGGRDVLRRRGKEHFSRMGIRSWEARTERRKIAATKSNKA